MYAGPPTDGEPGAGSGVSGVVNGDDEGELDELPAPDEPMLPTPELPMPPVPDDPALPMPEPAPLEPMLDDGVLKRLDVDGTVSND